jgi:uncharacterized protein
MSEVTQRGGAEVGEQVPVGEHERVGSVDVLRGVAVLGILMMNITAFGLPSAAYVNPMMEALEPHVGAFEGLTKGVWMGIHLLFDLKMMTIFSMLFGAGLVLQGERFEASGRGGFAGVYYRRLLWLFVIGMAHAYFIWYGDILVAYALCGLLLYPLRKLRAGWLISLGVVVTLAALPIWTGLGFALQFLKSSAAEAQAILDRGGTLNAEQQGMLDGWRDAQADMNPTSEMLSQEIAAMRGSWLESFRQNAKQSLFMQTFLFGLMTLWRGLGAMLIGMGLMKLGVFAAARSMRFYGVLAALGYGLGLPIVWYGGGQLIANRFDMVYIYKMGWHFNYVGSLLVALGHVAAVMLIVKVGAMTWVTSRLAAVGRMPLTNYLSQSILCTFVFWGWGLGLYAKVAPPMMVLVVLGVWVMQLVWSPWWMARYRFGPAEWAWRSLTYWKQQPMARGA